MVYDIVLRMLYNKTQIWPLGSESHKSSYTVWASCAIISYMQRRILAFNSLAEWVMCVCVLTGNL